MSSPQGAVAPGRADPIARPGVSTTDLMLLFMSIIWGYLATGSTRSCSS
jgi:hypothetical protein